MKRILFCICSCLTLHSFAQNGMDNLWMMGWGSSSGISRINFISGTPNVNSVNSSMNFSLTNGLISDSLGNILFYTNGCYIANAIDTTMFNGDGLNPGPCTSNQCPYGNIVMDGNIILPDPGNNNRYYLFHETCDFNSPSVEPSLLYYSVIDMSQQGGLGSVVQKNNVIINNGFLNWGFLTATKHANGRDWWIVVHQLNSSQFYTLLLTPGGLWGPFTQLIGPSYANDGTGQTVFSPDGSKLATTTWYNGLNANNEALVKMYLFDFDRCTGLFNNPLYIELDSVASGCGVAFSPNSRFLYALPMDSIVQYDLLSPNIAASRITIARSDSTNYPGGIAQLAYDQKIYICGGAGDSILHSINNPDSLGLNSNFVFNSIQLPHPNEGTLPNYPNYRLAAVTGSICDTITGIKEVGFFQYKLNTYPNPSCDVFYLRFTDTSEQIETVLVKDVLGREIANYRNNTNSVNLSEQPAGIYFLQTIAKSGRMYSVKLVKE